MKDPKWAAPVEYHLRKSLGAFLCSNSEDRKTFEELLRNMRVQQVPDIIVTKYVALFSRVKARLLGSQTVLTIRVSMSRHATIRRSCVSSM